MFDRFTSCMDSILVWAFILLFGGIAPLSFAIWILWR